VSVRASGAKQISLEDFSTAVAAIHAAAAFPERWPEAFSAVARLVNSSRKDSEPLEAPWARMLGFEIQGADDGLGEECNPAVRRVMMLLAPHLKAAREVRARLSESLPALATLERLSVAAFIADGAGEVQHMNGAARTLLAQCCCVWMNDMRLRFNQSGMNASFESALRAAARSPSRSTLLSLAVSQQVRYEITVAPLENDHARLARWYAERVLVLISQPWPDDKTIVLRARRTYGLTCAEARVMAALTMGKTVEEIAREHGVRPSTVRAQVRSIFEKTGVNRQTDLVRLALTGTPLIAGPES
jgi:DNA-binding NarL/FixJ family response regulator